MLINVITYVHRAGTAAPGSLVSTRMRHHLTAFLGSKASTDWGIRTPTSGDPPGISRRGSQRAASRILPLRPRDDRGLAGFIGISHDFLR